MSVTGPSRDQMSLSSLDSIFATDFILMLLPLSGFFALPHIVICVPIHDEVIRGFVSEPDGRGTIGILSSCVLTLTICLWTSLHLHIPPPTTTYFQILRRKLKWTIISAIAPEITAATALGQYFCVRHYVAKINSLPGMLAHANKWTMTDGFYANMGGYVLSVPNHPAVVLGSSHLIYLVQNNLVPLPPSSSHSIRDKSKADGMAKGLACLQTFWLVISCIARTIQHLPLTTLELSTISYVFFSFIIYSSLWHKPLDIRVPTTLMLSSAYDIKQDENLKALLADAVGFGKEDNFSSEYYLVPYRRNKRKLEDDRLLPRSFVIAPVLGFIYGVWHFLAWNFYFPSSVESYLWHICVVLTTLLLPLVFGLAGLEEYCQKHRINERGVCPVLLFLLGGLYTVARVAMIVEMFIGLRSLPAAAFETVQWISFIPHL